jgi:flagellar protein FlgJ
METKFANSFNYFDPAGIKKLLSHKPDQQEQAIKAAAQHLESVFLELVMKNMADANDSMKSHLFNRDTEDFFQDMYNQQLSLTLSKSGGIGLADVVVRQLTHKHEKPMQSHPSYFATTQPLLPKKISRSGETEQVEKFESINNVVPKKDPATTSKIGTMKEFVATLLPMAQKAAQVIGIDPKLLLAQSALETGWGKHIISHNLFGVKANHQWEGDTVVAKTLEYDKNELQVKRETFKAYPSFLESFMDYINLLKSDRYQGVLTKLNNPKAFLNQLQQSGYATDPQYADKVMSIYQSSAFQELI